MGKILIIGNGFDIAHGLPTKYGDFLEFLKAYVSLYDKYALDNRCLLEPDFAEVRNPKLDTKLINILHGLFVNGKYAFSSSEEITIEEPWLEELYNLVYNNIWYEYFSSLYTDKKIKGLNWIDFESEMSDIIQWIDASPLHLEDSFDLVDSVLHGLASDDKKSIFYKKITDLCGAEYYEKFIEELFIELEKLIRALDIYLSNFVEKIPVSKIDIINDINPDYVISFNYTHTYNKVYNQQIPICYIHGECGREIDTNIVLGIDEYLDLSDQKTHINMSIFKKFIQRIRNRNDIEYKEWSSSFKNQFDAYNFKKNKSLNHIECPAFEVYVYGHSLGITDKDILYDFLCPEYTSLKIYSYGKTEEGKLISRLIGIIGEDILIEKGNSNPRKLEFINCKK